MTPATDLRIEKLLQKTPNANVFLAYTRASGDKFVVKQIPFSAETQGSEELRIVQKLCAIEPHAHVVQHEAAFVQDGSLFIVMEACTNGDLHSLLEAQPSQRLAERDALHVWRQIVRGVRFLHQHGIAHRDLSLENVLLDDEGSAKICDFGLSAFITASRWCAGRVGKPYYMAPEVVEDERPYDAVRADLWSLGIILFILLTGSPLVSAAIPSDPAFQSLAKVGVGGILRHWRVDGDVTPRTVELLNKLLQIMPQHRFHDTSDVLAFERNDGPDA